MEKHLLKKDWEAGSSAKTSKYMKMIYQTWKY